MAFFAGKYQATIDEKGRVVLPSAFKKAMGEEIPDQVVLEKNQLKQCLDIHPMEVWQQKVEKLQAKVKGSSNERHYQFLLDYFENFTPVALAANGRINIPEDFLAHANLKREVAFLGMGPSINLSATVTAGVDKMSRDDYMGMLEEFEL